MAAGAIKTLATTSGIVTAATKGLIDLAVDVTGVLPGANTSELVNAQTGTTYTVVDGDRGKLTTLSNASSVAVTLPQAGASSLFLSGWYADYTNYGAGTVTITPTTSTIGGVATKTLATGQSVRVVSDGTNYQLTAIGGAIPAMSGVGAPGSTLNTPGGIYFDVADPMNPQFWWKT